MTRRSPEVVDGALGFQHHGSPRDASYVWEALDILADEVRALRVEAEKAFRERDECKAALVKALNERDVAQAEVERLRDVYEQAVRGRQEFRSAFAELRATIARAEALCDSVDELSGETLDVLLVRDALRGKP